MSGINDLQTGSSALLGFDRTFLRSRVVLDAALVGARLQSRLMMLIFPSVSRNAQRTFVASSIGKLPHVSKPHPPDVPQPQGLAVTLTKPPSDPAACRLPESIARRLHRRA